jgi:hypothetical protein
MSELVVGSLKGLAANNFVIEVASGSQLVQPGAILQVVQTVKTDTFTLSAGSFQDVTGFSATITPSSTSSKILVAVNLTGRPDTAGSILAKLIRDSTDIFIGDAASGFTQATTGGYYTSFTTFQTPINYLDSPATTSAITYKVAVKATSSTFVINRNGIFSGGFQYGEDSRLASSITLMEVAG